MYMVPDNLLENINQIIEFRNYIMQNREKNYRFFPDSVSENIYSANGKSGQVIPCIAFLAVL